MSQSDQDDIAVIATGKKWPFVGLIILGALVFAALITWTQRTVIADQYVQSYLDELKLDAEYQIVDLGLRRQHLRNVRLGDPARPDVTIDELVLTTIPRFSGVVIEEVHVRGARLFGEYRDSRLSLGVLDRFIYTGSSAPFELPDFVVNLDDVRAKISSEYGDIGLSIKGDGHLKDGFSGSVGAVSDQLAIDGCKMLRPTAFVSVTVEALEPKLEGPLRFAALDCKSQFVSGGKGDIQGTLALNRDLSSAKLSLAGAVGSLRYTMSDGFAVASEDIQFDVAGEYVNSLLSGKAQFSVSSLTSPWMQAGAANLNITTNKDLAIGELSDIASMSLAYEVRVDELAANKGFRQQLDGVSASLASTPIGPLWQKADPILARSARNARFSAIGALNRGIVSADSILLREANNRLIARAQDVQFSLVKNGATGLKAFDFALVHPQLPRLSGKWSAGTDYSGLSFYMGKYSAGSAAMEIVDGRLTWQNSTPDTFDLTGTVALNGPLPGDGYLQNATIVLAGKLVDGQRYYPRSGTCQPLEFEQLVVSDLSIDAQTLALCPTAGQPLLAITNDGVQLQAKSEDITINGNLGTSPFRAQLGTIDIGYPGENIIQNLKTRIGDGESATQMSFGQLNFSGGSELIGQFTDAEAHIGNVPLLLSKGQGDWSFSNSVLDVTSDDWTISDRAPDARFYPMQGKAIALKLDNGIITAWGEIYPQVNNSLLAKVGIRHDLFSATGEAGLEVPALQFSDDLQPKQLTRFADGIVELVDGVVTGKGHIEWAESGITSSGRFATQSMDLAAAFGPVKGLKGEIFFSDLLALETPPGQEITLAEVNPGVAAYNGVVKFQLLANQRVQLEDAHWPFSGGQLILEPTMFNLAVEEERQLNFAMTGLDAAQFLTQFDFENLAATGTFDGRLPMRFNRLGGRIEGGRLTVRPSGGTLAYVGELTYQDLSAYGNYAFSSLRDIRYRSLVIEMDGPLDGELVTRVRFDGLSQGETATRNFLTRQIAKLPIQFNVNIRAPFFELITSTRSLYDTNYLLDPKTLGLVNAANNDGTDQITPNDNAEQTPIVAIQPSESEDVP